MSTGYFSILRYVPDIARQESVNVGAIIACPNADIVLHDVRLATDRLHCFDPRFKKGEMDGLRSYIQAMIDRRECRIMDDATGEMKQVPVASKDFLVELRRRRTLSKVRLGDIGAVDLGMDIPSDAIVRAFLDDLIHRYVLPIKSESESGRPSKASRFKTKLADELRKKNLLGKDPSEGKVIQNARFEGLGWEFDFGIVGDRTRVVEALDVTTVNATRAVERVGAKHMKLEDAKEFFAAKAGEEFGAFIVVNGKNDDSSFQYRQALRRLAKDGEVIDYEDRQGMQNLLQVLEESVRRRGTDLAL